MNPSRRKFLIGLARAFSGALVFSLPMMMTMEMWQRGVTIDNIRLALLLLTSYPLLVGLAHYIGFEDTFDVKNDMVDAAVAYAVGFVTPLLILILFGVLEPGSSVREWIGVIVLQSFAGAVGALLAQSEFGGEQVEKDRRIDRTGYFGELFLMGVGALFLALNVAPTEEIALIAFKMTPWTTLVMMMVSLAIMHALVYTVGFHGQHDVPESRSGLSAFFTHSVTGYALVLLISLYLLWLLGAVDSTGMRHVLMQTVVLAFPGAIGAAAARLIL